MRKKPTKVFFFAFVLLVVVGMRVLYSPPPRLEAQASANIKHSSDTILLKRLKASQLTVSELVDSLDSPNADERGQAVAAIVALRNHYIDVAQQTTTSSLNDKSKGYITANALNTLAFLRPSDQALLQEADQNISFSPRISPSADPLRRQEYPAARTLIRASFAALPTLSKDFTTDVIKPGHALTKVQRLRLQCVAAILTTSAPAWFQSLSTTEHNVSIQKSLLYCSRIISNSPATPPGAPPPPPDADFPNGRGILSGFQETDAVNGELDTDDLDQIDVSTYVIHWNAAAGLADDVNFGVDPPVPPWPSERSVETIIASHDVERTIALLSYTICLRLNTDTNIKSKQPQPPFAEGAAVDAIKVLGNLRSTTLAPYVVWQHLRRASFKIHLENDTSSTSQACLITLGQIDVPAVRLLATRIGYELSPEQQRAATYALSKVLGSYTVSYLDKNMAVEQENMAAETNQSYKPEFQDKIANMKNMLALGTEKEWFKGDLYGYGKVDAYELGNTTRGIGL